MRLSRVVVKLKWDDGGEIVGGGLLSCGMGEAGGNQDQGKTRD